MFQQDRIFNPNEGLTAEEGGQINNNMKIRITGMPEQENMAYGGQTKYGLDLNRKSVQVDPRQSPFDSVSSMLTAVPRDEANIEAEGGETVYGDLDGDGALEHMKIEGARHTNGGVPLNVPEGSFVFSDTKKMKIKDSKVLSHFGKSYKKGGITPADIAKQYDINKYKAIVDDPDADQLSKATAQLMIKNYQKKLGELAMLQESMKGFPGGMPEVASKSGVKMPQAAYGGYLPKFQSDQLPGQVSSGNVDPRWIYAQSMLPQINVPTVAPISSSAFTYNPMLGRPDGGGLMGSIRTAMNASVPNFSSIGVNTATTGSPSRTVARNNSSGNQPANDVQFQSKRGENWYSTENYDKLRQLYFQPENDELRKRVYENYVAANQSQGLPVLGEHEFHNNFMEMQRGNYGLGRKYATDPSKLKGGDWDKSKGQRYRNEMAALNSGLAEGEPGYTTLEGNNVGDAQQAAISLQQVLTDPNLDPELKKNFGQYVNLSFTGRGNHYVTVNGKKYAISQRDNIAGDDTVNTILELTKDPGKKEDPGTVSGVKCETIDGKKQVTRKSFKDAAAMAAEGYTDASQESAVVQACVEPEVPGKTKVPPPPYRAPLPGLLNHAANMMYGPRKYMPFSPDLYFKPRQLALEDWQAQAQNLQQNYNSAAGTLGNFQPGNALASNLSFMAGQAADNIGQAIAGTTGRNVDRFNQYATQETQRKDAVDQYNVANRKDLWDKNQITNQQYDNAMRRYIAGVADSYRGNIWEPRSKWAMTNAVNRYFNVDPRTGRTYFTNNGLGTSDLGAYSATAGNWESLRGDYDKMRKHFPNITEDQYLRMRKGNMIDTDEDGYPNRTFYPQYGAASYIPMYNAPHNLPFYGHRPMTQEEYLAAGYGV